MFAWTPSDMSGIPREVIEHHLAVCPNARPVKQKARRQAPEKQKFIVQEVEKLKKASIIKEVVHPTWLSNGVVIPKHTGGSRLCIYFTDLNKACPKDTYPLPRIDQIVDSTTGCALLCFLDALWGPRTSRPKYPCAYISDPMIGVSLSTIKLVIKEHP